VQHDAVCVAQFIIKTQISIKFSVVKDNCVSQVMCVVVNAVR
jgi:hypothetical protein